MQAEIAKKYNKYQKLVASDPQNSHYMRKMKKYEQRLGQQSGGDALDESADLVNQINQLLDVQHNREILAPNLQRGGDKPNNKRAMQTMQNADLVREFRRGVRELDDLLDL